MYQEQHLTDRQGVVGWCDGHGLTSSAGASYNLEDSRARAYCACSRGGWGCLDIFNSPLSFLSSSSLALGDGLIWTEILSQRAAGVVRWSWVNVQCRGVQQFGL